jgi:hypothetical protein
VLQASQVVAQGEEPFGVLARPLVDIVGFDGAILEESGEAESQIRHGCLQARVLELEMVRDTEEGLQQDLQED